MTLATGNWIRAERYEFNADEHCISPVVGAAMRVYDPWALKDRPYHVLLEIMSKHGRAGLTLPAEQPDVVASVVDWCNQFGLLGTLLHRVISVTYEPRWVQAKVGNAGEVRFIVPEQRTHASLGSVWETESIQYMSMLKRAEPGMLGERVTLAELPSQSEPGALLVDLPGIHSTGGLIKKEPLTKSWAAHFPGVGFGDAYPAPMSEEFWKSYAEPVYEFVDAAWVFANALEAILQPAHEHAQAWSVSL